MEVTKPGAATSCAPAPAPAPPSAWFCTDPKTGTCKEEPIATGIQSGCASVNSSIKNGATTEEECKLSCFPKVEAKCSGDVGYCHDLPSDDNISCGPDAIEENRKCHKTMYKGMSCGCAANQSGAHDYGDGKVGCQGNDGFETHDTAQVTCATGQGNVSDWGFLGMGGHIECK